MSKSPLPRSASLCHIQPYSRDLSKVASTSCPGTSVYANSTPPLLVRKPKIHAPHYFILRMDLYSSSTAYGGGYSKPWDYSSSTSHRSQNTLTNSFIDGPGAILLVFVQILVLIDYSFDTDQLQNLYQSPTPRERREISQRRTRNDVKGHFGQHNTLKQDELTMRGKLYGGGISEPILTGDEIAQRPMLPTQTLPNTGVVKIAVLDPLNTSWTPPTLPIVTISNHPLEVLLSTEGLRRVKGYCRQPSDNIIALSAAAVLPLLKLHGWSAITKYFANPLRRKYRTIYKPSMSGEDAIAIPCYVNNCHWVSVVRREIGRQVIFCYLDDLNCLETEESIRTLLSQNTCPRFYPSYARWINCKSYTYRPHSNECGPRMLFETMIMLNHQNPHENILLPYMHPNLAQLSRVWIAQTILTGEPTFPCEPQTMSPNNMISSLEAHSQASSVIVWDSQQKAFG